MATKTSGPVRIDAELCEDASTAASVMSRNTAQQIGHWARIGRELEASAGVSVDDVAKVLAGERSYDALGTEEQAVVRAFWAERMTALSRGLRLDRDFAGEAQVLDNSWAATPFRVVARYANWRLLGVPAWPPWTPAALR